MISSILGVPLGILCGTYAAIARLNEPFIEFFRYLPAPAFGALAVAILGIYDGPKIAIIVIGTFFQQVLIIANTTRKLDFGADRGGADARHQESQASVARRHSRHLARSLPRPAHSARLGLDLSDRGRTDRHHHRHHLVHHPAGALSAFSQRLCRDLRYRLHRSRRPTWCWP